MSRSVKKCPDKLHRYPRGAKQARVHDCRAVPQDSFDDVALDKLCSQPYKAAKRMHMMGYSQSGCAGRLRAKFKLPPGDALKIAARVYRRIQKHGE